MSHDGCEEVSWKGVAFPYLMHHPNSYLAQTETYGSQRAKQGGHAPSAPSHGHQPRGSDTMTRAGTGTWNGPAPRGYARGAQTAAAAPVREPDFVRLSNGAKMPVIGLGTAGIREAGQVVPAIKAALAAGYRHFDCASVYGNEDLVGEGLKEWVASGKREELFVVSKLWNDCHRPEHVRASCEKTLSQLGLAYLDLYLMHWPEAWVHGGANDLAGSVEADTGVTILDTWRAMEALVDAGLVKSIGVSNFSLKQVEELLAAARIKPVVNQVELHPLLAQRKLTGVCFRKGVQCVAYSPLGGANHCMPNELLTHPLVTSIATEAGKSPAQVLLKWNLQRGVPVLPRASSEAHIRDNLEGMFEWKLSPEHKARLDELDSGKRFIDFPWKQWADPEEGGALKPSLVIQA